MMNIGVVSGLVFISLFFLPFTQALTFDLRFPLKIYEVSLVLSLILIITTGKFRLTPSIFRELRVLTFFLFVICVFFIFRIYFPAEGVMSDIQTRFGPIGDGISKICYLILCFLGLALFSRLVNAHEEAFIAAWLGGAVIASLYLWYLFVMSFLELDPVLLPGIVSGQKVSFGNQMFIRSGTFGEGNFMGLYLLLSISVATYARRFAIAIFLSFSLLVTFSTINLIGSVFFGALYLNYHIRRSLFTKKLAYLVVAMLVCVFGWHLLKESMYIDKVIVDKILAGSSESKLDRIDQAVTGLSMFSENPILGVGLSRYGYYYQYFQYSQLFDSLYKGEKRIANNVYVELLSELGLTGLIIFSYFMYMVYKRSKIEKLYALRYGFISMLFVFFAFPTYSLMFLWAFWGLIIGTSIKYSSTEEICVQCTS